MKADFLNKLRTVFLHRAKRHEVLAVSAALFVILAGFLIYRSMWHSPSSTTSSFPLSSQPNNSPAASLPISGTDKSYQALLTVNIVIPLWYSPGALEVGDLAQTEWGDTSIEGIDSGGYIYINEEKAALLQTGEHKGCKYFRINAATGKLECLDHIVRNVLMPKGVWQLGDEIYMDYSSNCTNRYLLFYINHSDATYRGSFRFDLADQTFARLPIDLRKDENWVINKEYTYLVIGKYTNRWRYYKVDIATNVTTEILETEENTTYSFGLTATNRYFWYATYHGQSKDTWCYYDMESGARRTIHTMRIFCVTPDDRYIVYYNETGLRRMELSTGEDILLDERGTDPYWERGGIEAYNPSSGRVLLSWLSLSDGEILYVYDTVTGKGEKLVGFDESIKQTLWQTYGKDYQVNSCTDEAESLRNSKGTDTWLMDKTGQYVFFYIDAPRHAEYIYCYGMVTGELFKVALPEAFFDKMQQQIKNQFNNGLQPIVDYRLYLTDDATRIFLTYEVIKYDYGIPQGSSSKETSSLGK